MAIFSHRVCVQQAAANCSCIIGYAAVQSVGVFAFPRQEKEFRQRVADELHRRAAFDA